jgi:hypothetical protein
LGAAPPASLSPVRAKNTSCGIACAKRAASAGSSSTSPWRSSLVTDLARDLVEPGPMTRHGPHHGAQKSTTTGRSLVTTPSNVAFVTCTIELLIESTPFDLETLQCRAWIPRPPARRQLGRVSRNRASSFMCASKKANTGIER